MSSEWVEKRAEARNKKRERDNAKKRSPGRLAALKAHRAQVAIEGAENARHFEFRGDAVRRARTTLGMTHEDVARRHGIPASTLGAWEMGKAVPTAANYVRLCHALQEQPGAFVVEAGKAY